MSIKDFPKKIKPYWQDKAIPLISKAKAGLDIKEEIFIILTIILIGLAGFGLGRLSALEKSGGEVTINKAAFTAIIKTASSTDNISSTNIEKTATPMSASAMIAGESAKGLLVASKSGKKYHFPWCAGASQIAEKNKIWFASYESAQKAGYTAASNCPGLK